MLRPRCRMFVTVTVLLLLQLLMLLLPAPVLHQHSTVNYTKFELVYFNQTLIQCFLYTTLATIVHSLVHWGIWIVGGLILKPTKLYSLEKLLYDSLHLVIHYFLFFIIYKSFLFITLFLFITMDTNKNTLVLY